MKVATAGLMHETHTFLPEKTPIDPFDRDAVYNEEVVSTYRDTNTVMGGFITACRCKEDVELIPTVHSRGGVSGTVVDEVYDTYAGEIVDAIEGIADELDGVLLFLHGAMVTETHQDPETDLVKEVRDVVGDKIPIMVGMDLHGNISPEMVEITDGICAYQSSPHVDQAETGKRTAQLLFSTLDGDVSPTMAISKPGLVVPSPFSATTTSPAKDIMLRLLTWDIKPELHDVTKWDRKDDIVDVSFFFGFAWSDVSQLGVSVIAITDGDRELAQEIADDVADFAWDQREEITNPSNLYDTEEGVSVAAEKAQYAKRPILLLDHADRLSETTYVLRELIDQDVNNVAFPLLHDPEAVEVCFDAGEGNRVEVSVGSKTSPRGGEPVEISGTVEWVGHNSYTGTGPMQQGQKIDHGPTAIIDVDGIWLQITSNMDTSMIDTDPIEQYGYDASSFDVIVSKSKTHFRAVYEDFAEEIVIVDASEYSPADLTKFEYTNAPSDLFPLSKSG